MSKNYHPFKYDDLKEVFEGYPEPFKSKLLYLRELIFDVAKNTPSVGSIEEDLRWGEPSYLTLESKSGSAIRMDWKPKSPDQYALFFNCKTTLISDFKSKFKGQLRYGGNRSLIFYLNDSPSEKVLRECIKMALTYHLKKKVS